MRSTGTEQQPGIPSDAEFQAAGLLDRECAATGRLDLLRMLAEEGFSIDDMVAALEVDGLGSMMGDHRLVPGERLARDEAMDQSGLPRDSFDAMALALGFRPIQGSPAGEVGYTADELTAFSFLAGLWAIFTPEEALSLVRTIGSSFGRMATPRCRRQSAGDRLRSRCDRPDDP
jgi:hypothetical protein